MLSRGVRRHNRSLSRGDIEDCPGGVYKFVPGGSRYNIILFRGGGGGGGGGTFAIIIILAHELAHIYIFK